MNLMGKLFKRDSEKPAERKPADIQGKVNTNPKTGAILSGEQKQRIVKQKLKEKKNSNIPKTCQDTIVYKEIYKDPCSERTRGTEDRNGTGNLRQGFTECVLASAQIINH